jgi:lysophospholipase L1-like esterase
MRTIVLVLLVALLGEPAASAREERMEADCAATSVGLSPLTDLGGGRYHGYRGGLYPDGRNVPPKAYAKTGAARGKAVKPVEGKVVLLSIGMSNTTQEFSAFKRIADADARKSPALTIVDGAQGGQDAEIVKDPTSRFWRVVDQRLAAAGATARQVQAVWLKEAIARESTPFPADAKRLQADLAAIVRNLRARFPNLKLVYLSSRTYGGYASTPLNPEPFAYESGFAVKWLVADRIAGRLKGPWVGWGPYLWTDGERGRRDGLVWTCADTRPSDGTHPSESGRQKVAQLLLKFFTTDATARPWFLKPVS